MVVLYLSRCCCCCLCNNGTGSGGLVLPVGGELSGGSVVSCQSVDSRFNENQTKLGVLVLTVAFQMLTNLDGLFDEHVQVLWDFGGKSVGLEDTDDLLSRDGLDLCDSVRISQNDANLRGVETLSGELADVFFNVGGRSLEPRGRRALVGFGTLGDTLSGGMHTTHGDEVLFVEVLGNDKRKKRDDGVFGSVLVNKSSNKEESRSERR
mmetsp:Transcript_7818/g.14496  ORF Transcript_7818/g.14496 Transcript_7818/m.14496 type:complete len:208 (+) Transcript_7818:383-1006(+)